MTTFTSTLPKDLIKKLNEAAKQLEVPKNRLIEKALRIYLDQLTKAEYIRSFKQSSGDDNLLDMAEEGMEDYFNQLNP